MIEIVYQQNNLEVKVEETPIGGYRGQVGTLTIGHVKHKVYTEWEQEDLKILAQLIQKILNIHEASGIFNTLIFARQDNQEFKLSLVPYPACNIKEKIQGLLHVIFGAYPLLDEQVTEISDFYRKAFTQSRDPGNSSQTSSSFNDVFCKPQIIQEQRIKHITFESRHYDILQDRSPRIVQEGDAHFLIVPEGSNGHQEGSQVSIEQRTDLLVLIQKAMNNFVKQGFETLIFLERNGPQLRSVPHKHEHVHGVQEFPKTFLGKIKFLWNQIIVKKLTPDELSERIATYQNYLWD